MRTEKNIRLMEKSDYDAIRVLHQGIYREKNPDEDWSVEDFETYFEEGMSFVYCDDADKSKIQGFIFATTKILYSHHASAVPYDIFIGNIAVAKLRRGIGSELLKAAIEGASKKLKEEAFNIGLCVEATNQSAIKFYEKNGFVIENKYSLKSEKQASHIEFYMVKLVSLIDSLFANIDNLTTVDDMIAQLQELKRIILIKENNADTLSQTHDVSPRFFSPEEKAIRSKQTSNTAQKPPEEEKTPYKVR